MGLFGSNTITTVGTSISRVIEDKDIPDSIYRGTMNNLVAGDEQPTEYIMEELVTGVGLRADRMFNYGKKTYSYGLPVSAIRTTKSGTPQLQSLLQSLHGGPVSIDYLHFGPLNNLHVAWYTLVNAYAYDQTTNEIRIKSADVGKKVYLKDITIVISEATLAAADNGALDQWGPAPSFGADTGQDPVFNQSGLQVIQRTKFEVNPGTVTSYAKVYYTYETTELVIPLGSLTAVSTTVIKTDSFLIPLNGFELTADYFQAKYKFNGKIYYFTYKFNEGTYPALDAVYSPTYNALGSFYPWTYFRYNKTSMDVNKNSDEYKTSKKLVKFLNMEYQDVIEGINGNPDIKDVEQCFLIMGVPAKTTNEIEIRYLFEFFDNLRNADLGTTVVDKANASFGMARVISEALEQAYSSSGRKTVVIQDRRFKMAMHYDSITKLTKKGIGKPNTYTTGYREEVVTVPGTQTNSAVERSFVSTIPGFTYRKQVNESLYEEIVVTGLEMTYYIFEQYTTTLNEGSKILLVPLDKSITKYYSVPRREELYSRSLHYVFNSRVVTKLKWYQTGIFKAILIIIAIIITFFTWGATWQLIVAATSYAAIAYILLIALIKYLVIRLVVKLFIKAVGVKIAFIVAIVAAIAGYGGEALNELSASMSETLLSLSTSLISGAQDAIKRSMNDLLGEYSDFNKYVEEQTKTLDKAKDLLDTDVNMRPYIIFGEKPNDYFDRTVHSGNIGVLSFDMISSFCDSKLSLPTLNDSVGEKSDDS